MSGMPKWSLVLALAACFQLANAAPIALFAGALPRSQLSQDCTAAPSRFSGLTTLRWAQTRPRRASASGPICAQGGSDSKGEGGEAREGGTGPLAWLRNAIFPSPEEIQRAAAERRKAEVRRKRSVLPKGYSRTTVQQEAPPVNASRYVPPELSPSGRKKADMTWEDRVRYESQRDGNRFRQNTILTETLKRGG